MCAFKIPLPPLAYAKHSSIAGVYVVLFALKSPIQELYMGSISINLSKESITIFNNSMSQSDPRKQMALAAEN